MSYVYEDLRQSLFTQRGEDTETLRKIRRNVVDLARAAGAVRAHEAWSGIGGDSWLMLAALDYLVETGVIIEVTGPGVWAQHRVFVLKAQ